MATPKPVGLDRTWSVAVDAVAVDEVLGLLGDFGVVRVDRQVVMRRVQVNPMRCALALKAATVLDQVTEVLRLDVRRHVVNGVHGSSSQLSVQLRPPPSRQPGAFDLPAGRTRSVARQSPRVATKTALMLCIRFSAWSKTTDRGDSKTSSVTSSPSNPYLVKICPPTVVSRLWKLGRQCMKRTSGFPVAVSTPALTWYGDSSSIRRAQACMGSPIETQTSVCTKSAPRTPSATSSVSVTRAPLPAATPRACATSSSAGQSSRGAQSRTSMPRIAPVTSSEFPMLLRASPRKQ